MARLLAMVLRTRADRPASPQRFEGADPLSCASDGCRPAGSALQTGPRAAAVKHPNWSAARAHGPLLYETGTTWRAEASRRGPSGRHRRGGLLLALRTTVGSRRRACAATPAVVAIGGR